MTVFRRRQPRTKTQHARELVWPSAGWRRAGKYFWYRIVRMPGTPYSIAAGLACGVAVSFTPFLGCHFIMAAIFAWIIRANLLASAIGTAAGNPYSFPFIWVLVYNVGVVLLGWEGQLDMPEEISWRFLWENFVDVFVPLLVGGVPVGAAFWLMTFFPAWYGIERYQRLRRTRLAGIRRPKASEEQLPGEFENGAQP